MNFAGPTADSVPGFWTAPRTNGCERAQTSTSGREDGCPQSSAEAGAVTRTRAKARLDGASGFSYGPEASTKLSMINGEINKMTKEELQDKMLKMRLNTCGSKDVLKKRIKNHYRKQRLGSSVTSSSEKLKYRYLVVIDYEATCSETNENFVHEIIEFPAILVDTQNMAVCNVFQRFCKPTLNPILTEFCTTLTGISQSQVDKAQLFPEVYLEFEEWMVLNKLGTEHQFAILTDGPWDMARFLKGQTELSELEFPYWAKSWINLRKAYSAFYGVGRVNLQHMLDDLGMKFEGRPHSGLDDAKNIANIVIRLIKDGCVFRTNEYFHEGQVSPPRKGLHKKNSPNKSRMTQVNRDGAGLPDDVPQEGDNMADLFDLIRIQQS